MNFIETEIEKRPYTSFMFQKEKESSAGALEGKKVFCKIWKSSGKKFHQSSFFVYFSNLFLNYMEFFVSIFEDLVLLTCFLWHTKK